VVVLGQFKAQYTVNKNTASDTFQVPTFGMSCYMIALESDYGTPHQVAARALQYTPKIHANFSCIVWLNRRTNLIAVTQFGRSEEDTERPLEPHLTGIYRAIDHEY
jgi:hypothetical protein